MCILGVSVKVKLNLTRHIQKTHLPTHKAVNNLSIKKAVNSFELSNNFLKFSTLITKQLKYL